MPKFKIRPLAEQEFIIWDAFVNKSSCSALFYKMPWLKASGWNFTIYGYFKGGELYAGIPISWFKQWGFKVALQPVLTPYLEITFKEQDAKYEQRLSKEKEAIWLLAQRLKHDFDYIYFHVPPGPVDLQPFIWEGFSISVKYTFIIDLNKNLAEIWNDLNHTKRNEILKSQQMGIKIILSDDFEQTFKIIEKTFSRQGIKLSNKAVADNYNKVATEAGQGKSFHAIDKYGNTLAVEYLVWDNKISYGLLGGRDSESSCRGAKALAIWEGIKFSKGIGLQQFDFHGSMIPQIEQFVRKFGGKQTPYFTIIWCKPYLKIPVWIRNKAKATFTHSAFFNY
ncbi:GNAT family N-acetyltransferase [Chloroflexota bacterium]